ncbi:MAG TPA: hypothetical protein VG944_13365 [Fimbriimonas sp.]|nr:hypothetical protein [Fimbriimonas sp.]
MTEACKDPDEDLFARFCQAAVPRPEWTHRAHVKIAYLHLRRFPFDEALSLVRTRIQALNCANGIEEGPTMGYNETTTVAFMRIVHATMLAYRATGTADEFCDAHPQLMTPKVLRLFYSPERRMDPMAKTTFVEPDLAPLPEYRQS